jgi:hypothetical protein
MRTKFKPLMLSATFFFAWGYEEGVAMEEQGITPDLSMSQEGAKVFDQQILEIKKYIASLDVAPNLVFGVTSSEEGVGRFDKSWIFVDIYHKHNNPRNLTLSFNATGDMQAFAKAFPNTFQTIAFDAEVPTYIEGFGPNHLRYIHAALKMGGEFYLPWQYAMGENWGDRDKWSDKSPDQAVVEFSKENNLENRPDMLDPIVNLPLVLGRGQDDEINQKIVEEIRDKNYLRVMKEVFGAENVEILQTRRLPFPENEGRLTNPPYVDVFLAKKAFPTEDIPELTVAETPSEERLVENERGGEELPVQPLAGQIQALKEKIKDHSPSLVVIIDGKEQPGRFDGNWVKIIPPYDHSQGVRPL